MKKGIKPIRFNFSSLLFMGMLAGTLSITQVYAQSQEEQQSQQDNLHYISPRLQLGIHTEAALDSPIKELISSGSVVEVINTVKEFSQVKTEQGTQGWIKSKFLTQEEPAELKVKQLEQALTETQQQLQAEQDNKENIPEKADIEGNDTETQLSQAKMAAYEDTIAELKAEIKAWEQLDSQDKKAHKEQADQINKHLKERLTKIAELATGKAIDASHLNIPETSAVKEASKILKLPFLKELKKDFLLNVMIGGICFILGIFLMDLFNRRRHGGYRI